ncbi:MULTISPECIES: DUF3270 family protein [unclassified Enterococcus]|uniref:DUF3270 family protein n=1 Tax=unclassified Enterococcus TaxID=2608891 RepID=UPI001552813E|nr:MULTISPECIES: DUF3270 family protein [unclassified Enterococcus]MBS7578128.1 DUF3270 family protein [Enterococcus sp. MMGLQ5-2]MBS7585388.1 DUF3270 family protein [Enterococcus sp. MMGLQ5-1]NPD13245.1 DUF3270 family protein [Enterococcus sp. MMGLQ5-1]NPD37959.1 DUF3270 family protein [Enterococcus sp. MMGLQ5-2]
MEARKVEFESVEWVDSQEIIQESIQTPAIDKIPLIVAPEQKDIDDLFFFAQVAIEGILTVLLSYMLLLFFTSLPVFIAIFLAAAVSFMTVKVSKHFYQHLRSKH